MWALCLTINRRQLGILHYFIIFILNTFFYSFNIILFFRIMKNFDGFWLFYKLKLVIYSRHEKLNHLFRNIVIPKILYSKIIQWLAELENLLVLNLWRLYDIIFMDGHRYILLFVYLSIKNYKSLYYQIYLIYIFFDRILLILR